MLAFLAAAFAALLAIYVVASTTGPWFARAQVKTLGLQDLTVARGTGQVVADPYKGKVLALFAADSTGLALVSANTDLRSADFAQVAVHADRLPEGADVRLLWRSDAAPTRVNTMPLTVAAGRLVPAVVSKDPNWVGRIVGIAVAIRGPIGEPVRVTGVTFKPGGVYDALSDVLVGWLAFERWSGASINTLSGGADVVPVPLSMLLVAAVVLAALAWVAWARRRGNFAHLPIALAAAFVAAWLVLDAQWAANLARQVAETRAQFGGKDARARHEAADDAEVFKFIERVRAKLPPTPTRVFMLADAAPFRGRGAYYLYPHNVLFDPFANSLPQVSALRAGDYVVVYHRRGIQYSREARRLVFEGGASVAADVVMIEPGAGLFRIA